MYRLRQDRGRHQGRVGDPDPVVDLVPLAEPAQDGDRVLDRWLVHDDGLEAALEGGVLLDVLAVLVQGRGADAVQLAPREERLEHVGGVHRPSAAPAPTTVCSSSMNRMIWPSEAVTSLSTALRRSSNSPRYLAPATMDPRSRATTRFSLRPSGTSPRTMRWASPSAMAVLPTPGSPMSTGLFFVRRLRTWMTRRISSSRPMTGSSLPSRAASVRSRPYLARAS